MCEKNFDVLVVSTIILVLNIYKIWTILYSFRDFAQFLPILDFVFIVIHCLFCVC